MDTKELETLDRLHYRPIHVNEGLFGLPFPEVHNHILCLAHIEGEVAVLAPHCQVSDKFSVLFAGFQLMLVLFIVCSLCMLLRSGIVIMCA